MATACIGASARFGHPKRSRTGDPGICGKEYWIDPMLDYWLHGVIRRNSPIWKVLYKKRGDIERIFKTLKQNVRLEQHCLRGLGKIALHSLMSTLVYVTSALVHVEAGDIEGMRWMVREVA